jgi:hypothetical protein
MARPPKRNGTSGLSRPRACRRADHQKYVTQVKAIRPAGQPEASNHSVNPDTGTAVATTTAAARRAPYSRASR